MWALFSKPTDEPLKILPDWFKIYNKKQINNPNKYFNLNEANLEKNKINDKNKIEKRSKVLKSEDE